MELEKLRQLRLQEELERERIELKLHREKEQILVQRELQELQTIKEQVEGKPKDQSQELVSCLMFYVFGCCWIFCVLCYLYKGMQLHYPFITFNCS